ncbi:hypothetical protein ACVW06_001729 [Pantoea ananatis]
MGKYQRAWSNGKYIDAGPNQAGFEEDRLKLSFTINVVAFMPLQRLRPFKKMILSLCYKIEIPETL